MEIRARLAELKLRLQGRGICRHLISEIRGRFRMLIAMHAEGMYRGMIGSGSSQAMAFPEHVLQNPPARSHRHVFGCDAKLP